MQIGIIGGTGAEGRGLAARLAAASVPALLGSRDRTRAEEAIDRINGAAWIQAATNDAIVDTCDVVFLTVPFASVGEFLAEHGPRFRDGAVVIDVTVPLKFVDGAPVFEEIAEGSATELVRSRLPDTVRVAGSLKTIPASVLLKVDMPLDCDEFVCGDSPAATSAAKDVIGRIPGLRPIDAGGLDAARALERMTLLAVGINKRYKVRTARFRVIGV